MDDFKNFLKENNYENDLEFQLCDLEMAFNAGRKLQWKPREIQKDCIEQIIDGEPYNHNVLIGLFNDLKKL